MFRKFPEKQFHLSPVIKDKPTNLFYPKKLFWIVFFVFFACEDKKSSKVGFGSINANIVFERILDDSNDIPSDLPSQIDSGENLVNNDFSLESKKNLRKNHNRLILPSNTENSTISVSRLEKISLSSTISYVVVTIAELDPVEIVVSGSSAKTTINDIPVGPQSVKIDLLSSQKIILYTETKSVTIVDGQTASPTFNNFTAENESLKILAPNGGEAYFPGKRMAIRWERSHEAIPVKIELFSGSQFLRSISSSAENSGLFNYDIPIELDPRDNYQIKISSTQNSSVSDFSDNFFSLVDVIAPSAPSGLAVVAGDRENVLSWNANQESDFKEYKLYGGTSSNSTTVLATISKGTQTYTHSNLLNGTTYYYQISAVDNIGNESAKSSEVNAKPQDSVAPSTPTGLAASPSDGSVTLTWNANNENDLASYNIWGGLESSISQKIGEVQAGTQTFTQNFLTNGITYYYGISAVDNNGNESSKTSAISATPKGSSVGSGGNALSFDGDDYLDIGANSAFDLDKFSISAWVKTTKSNGYVFQAEQSFGYHLLLEGGSPALVLWYNNTGNGCTATSKVDDGNWHHISASYDGANTNIYIDGILNKSCSSGSRISRDKSTAMTIGAGGKTSSAYHFEGSLDEVSVWNKALTSGEFDSMYNSGTALDLRSDFVNYNSTDNLIAYWKMEDGSGLTATDVSGYGHDGTISGASWVEGVVSTSYDNTPKIINSDTGNSLSFDGSDDKIDFGDQDIHDFGTGDFTIQAWINPDNVSQVSRIVSRGDTGTSGAYQLNINSNGRLRISFYDGSPTETNSNSDVIKASVWQHLILSRSGGTVKGYVNAVEVISFSNSSNLSSSQSLVVGYEPRSNGSYYDGLMDEVAIWNDGLTAKEVEALYNSGIALDARNNAGDYSSTANLIGYWKMEDASGTTLTDVSGSSNDGAISGALWAEGVVSTSYDNTPLTLNQNNVTVKKDGSGDYTSIQGAINAVSSGGTITVYGGTYNVNDLTVDNKSITIVSASGNSSTILDGESKNRIMTIKNNDSHIFVLDGFTITNGHALSNSGYVIRAENGTNTFKNLILENNGQNTGNTLFRGNHRDSTTFESSIIRNNKAENSAGIGQATVINCLIYGNEGWNNTSPLSNSNVINSTIVNNGGGSNNPWTTGGLTGPYMVINSIIRGNGGAGQIYDPNNTMSLSYSNTPGYSGNGIIDADPLFVDEANHDYRLSDGSPCIAAGTTSNAPSVDLEGNPRPSPSGTNPDMGAYEFDQILSGGNALSFDGSDDYVYVGKLGLSSQISISTWFKTSSSKVQRIISSVDTDNNFFIMFDPNQSQGRQFKFNVRNNEVYATKLYSEYTDGKWHNAIGTWDGNTMKLYIDGQFVSEKNGVNTTIQNSDTHLSTPTGSERFNGSIDETALWSKALTANEVSAIYNSSTALDVRTNAGDYSSSNNLVAYWKMEDASGTTLTDVSGNSKDGAISGASWSEGVLSTSYDNTPLTLDKEAPAVPTSLKSTPKQSATVELVWDSNNEADFSHYNIYGSTSSDPTYKQGEATTNSQSYSGLERGETYYFRITAVDNSGNESAYSDQVVTAMVSNVSFDHSTGSYGGSVGLSNGGSVTAASRWVNHLYEKHGVSNDNNLYFSYIHFYANDTNTGPTYKLKAWKGDMQAYPTSSNNVLTQDVSVSSDGYKLVEIANPVQLDISKMFSFGVEVQHSASTYPLGRDDGVAYKGYGDLYSSDGNSFSALGDAGVDHNWLLTGEFIDSNDEYIDSYTLSFTSQSTVETPVLTSGQSYYLRITGFYGVAGGTAHADAAFSWINTDRNSGGNYTAWEWEGKNDQRPSPDTQNTPGTYYFYFKGDGSSEKFNFSDSAYGDNAGSLIIEVWKNN